MDTGVTLFLLTAGFGLSFAYAIILLVTRYKQCAPDEILVIYGRVDGGRSSKCIHGGGILVWPLIQDWAKLSLMPMTIEIPVDNAVSVDDIKMNIKSNFTVAISTEPEIMHNAADHLLHLVPTEIKSLVSEIILGQLRMIFSIITHEQISSGSEDIEQLIHQKIGTDLANVGIKIIAFHISSISNQSDVTSEVSQEKLNHYLGLTKKAREKATPIPNEGTKGWDQLEIMLKMADDYSSDARFFMENGDYVRAFGAINYAHAWIDAGVKLRLLDGHGDDELFTLP